MYWLTLPILREKLTKKIDAEYRDQKTKLAGLRKAILNTALDEQV